MLKRIPWSSSPFAALAENARRAVPRTLALLPLLLLINCGSGSDGVDGSRTDDVRTVDLDPTLDGIREDGEPAIPSGAPGDSAVDNGETPELPGGSPQPAPEGSAFPSLTDTLAPDAGDEPTPQDERFHTSVDLPILEDPYRPPFVPWSDITEAEFAAGPLAPVVIAPPGHDFDDNQPPYFPDLGNVTVAAGDRLELHLAPVDPDGGIAGQYLKELYPGATYVDNFDTTRTFVWSPLQPDVGIRNFTVYTVDPTEPGLRVAYTIRIKVVLPEDPASIVNLRPGIDRVAPQTVRLGDPVVVQIKGTDPNGTLPRVEITEYPPDTTFMRHRDDPRIRVLRFVPTEVGTITLQAIAHDAVDPELTLQKSIVINVEPAEGFERRGERLRNLASARGFRIGYASSTRPYHRADGGLYAATASTEFNIVTPENSMKWDRLNPAPGVYNWAAADNLITFAGANDMLVHGHTLVWYTQLPAWVKETAPETRETHMRQFIERVLERYADDVPLWDVVNESLDSNGGLRNSIWLEAMGPEYIEKAFRYARAAAPDATLLYNEYDIGWQGPKARGLLRLLDSLIDAETPIDGVGFQMHVDADFDLFHELADMLAEVSARGLDVYITELDVSMRGNQTLEQQAAVYGGVVAVCLEAPRCKALQTWGFTDRYSWREPHTPLLFDREYQPKPAYRALQRRLAGN